MKHFMQIAVFILAVTAAPVHADGTHPRGIRLDGTVGNAGQLQLPGPDYEIKAEYGTQAGANLFHSFQQFNIHSDESATFTGPDSVQNIISRVTGGDASRIDGELASAIPGADLFLLNPAGVMFGPNASLDLGGSFHVSTADYLRMGENEKFFTEPVETEVLSAASPAAFGFLDNDVAPISFDGSRMGTLPGKEFTMTGGDITLEKSWLTAPDGTVGMASVASPGEIELTETGIELSSFDSMGNISLSYLHDDCKPPDCGTVLSDGVSHYRGGATDVSGDRGGLIVIRGGDMYLSDTLIASNSYSTGNGKGIDIELSGTLRTENGDISTHNHSSGQGGLLSVRAENIFMNEKPESTQIGPGSYFTTRCFGTGNAGRMTIVTSEFEINRSILNTITEVSGDAGSISIDADKLEMSHRSYIQSSSYGSGDAGQISINAGNVSITSGTHIVANVQSDSPDAGHGGDITINADEILVSGYEHGSSRQSSSFICSCVVGSADGGSLNIEADRLKIDDIGVITTMTAGSGNAGPLNVSADYLEISRGGQLNSSSATMGNQMASGNGGPLNVKAKEIRLSDVGVIFSVGYGTGDSGDLNVEAERIEMTGGGYISTSTLGYGETGDISISVTDTLRISGYGDEKYDYVFDHVDWMVWNRFSEIGVTKDDYIGPSSVRAAVILEDGTEQSGNIEISAGRIDISDGGKISGENRGSGDAGSVTITTDESFRLNNSTLTTNARNALENAENSGKITIHTGSSLNLRNSSIITSVGGGKGKGGDVIIASSEFITMDNSKIQANAFDGPGGNIRISAGQFIQSSDSIIQASSEQSIDGDISIEAPDADITGSLTVLPSNYIDVARFAVTPCSARTGESISRFTIKGRDASPTSSTDLFASPPHPFGILDCNDPVCKGYPGILMSDDKDKSGVK
ncbi:MAG: filamentous hemagglutinin N-terminal domain-containing protein [Desulfobacterales bacterium]|nr:filamentous hemagglutinin N-terminal domain-containing protein [Desulfobacterales bacterium]